MRSPTTKRQTQAALPGIVNTLDSWRVSLIAEENLNDSDKIITTVPASSEMQVLWIWIELTTAADVGNRQIVVEIQDPANDVVAQVRAGIVQAASLTRYYMFASSLADMTAFRDTDYLMTPLPPTLVLRAGDQVRVYDNNAVAAATDDMIVQMQVATRTI